jgi:hypothetical protein
MDAGQPRNLMLAEDVAQPDLWRVEWFDRDGRAYITVFAGPSAGERAATTTMALRTGVTSQMAISAAHGHPGLVKRILAAVLDYAGALAQCDDLARPLLAGSFVGCHRQL